MSDKVVNLIFGEDEKPSFHAVVGDSHGTPS